MEALKPHAKALVLLVLIVVAAVVEQLGLQDLGLDLEHYVGLLVADLVVWLTPNKGYTYPPTDNQ